MNLQEMNQKEELVNCTFVKTVLMLIVVFFHSIVFWRGGWFDIIEPAESFLPYSILAQWLQSFHVYAFALVSGYLFYYVKYECRGYKNFSKFVKKKAARLLVPYYFISAVWAVPIGIYFFRYGVQDIIRDYIFGYSPNQLWFLLMLFWALIILFFLSDVIRKNAFVAIAAAVLFYGMSIAVGRIGGGYLQISTGCAYVPFLIAGFLIREYEPPLLQKIPVSLWIIGDILLLLGSKVLALKTGAVYTVIGLMGNLLLHMWGALMAFYVLQRLARVISWQENMLFGFLAKRSMVIYMLHQQVIYFALYFMNGRIAPAWLGIVIFLFSIAVSCLLATLLLRFQITRFLIGEK